MVLKKTPPKITSRRWLSWWHRSAPTPSAAGTATWSTTWSTRRSTTVGLTTPSASTTGSAAALAGSKTARSATFFARTASDRNFDNPPFKFTTVKVLDGFESIFGAAHDDIAASAWFASLWILLKIDGLHAADLSKQRFELFWLNAEINVLDKKAIVHAGYLRGTPRSKSMKFTRFEAKTKSNSNSKGV